MARKGYHSGPRAAAQVHAEQDRRGADYDSRFRIPAYFAEQKRKAAKNAALEERVRTTLQHAVEKSSSSREAALILAEVAGGSPQMYEKALDGGVYEQIKSGARIREGEVQPQKEVGWATRATAILITLGFTAGAANAVITHFEKNPNGFGASAESDSDYGRAGGDSYSSLANLYQKLQTDMNAALDDGQVSTIERGQLQQDVQQLQAGQTQTFLNYLSWLAENQTKEGGNVSVITSVSPKVIHDPPETPTDFAFYSLRDQILPDRNKNLQDAGVDKSAAGNYSPLSRLYQSMREMVRAHQENDAAVEEMYNTQVTVGPEKVSDIGTTPEKTSAPLLKLMKIMHDPGPGTSFTEELYSWLDSPDTWDFVNGVYKQNPTEVLRALAGFYSEKIQPAAYDTAVTNWTPVPHPANHAPVVDTISIGEASIKSPYRTRINGSDFENDSLTFKLTGAPEGMIIDSSTGEIVWAQPVIGSYSIAGYITDGKNQTAFNYQLNVTDGNHAPAINSNGLKVLGQTRHAYAQQIIASDPDGDALQYRLVAGPRGMSMDRNGMVNWTPGRNQTGEFNVTVEVSDGKIPMRLSYTIKIDSDNKAPTIIGTPETLVKVGKAWEPKFVVNDSDGDALEYELIVGDAHKEKNTNGVFSWFAEKLSIGKVPYTLIAKDPYGGVARQDGNLTVVPNQSPQAPTVQKITLGVGGEAHVSIKGIDPDGDKINYRIENAPAGVTARIDENGNLILKGLKAGSGKVSVVLDDGVDPVTLDVDYKVENNLPYQLAAGAIAAVAGFGTLGAGFAVGRKPRVREVFAIDGGGKLVGAWGSKGEYLGDEDGYTGPQVLLDMARAARDQTSRGLTHVAGRRFVVEHDGNGINQPDLTLIASTGTAKAKPVRGITNALRRVLNDAYSMSGGRVTLNPVAAQSVRASVSNRVFDKAVGFIEWFEGLARELDDEVPLVKYQTAPIVRDTRGIVAAAVDDIRASTPPPHSPFSGLARGTPAYSDGGVPAPMAIPPVNGPPVLRIDSEKRRLKQDLAAREKDIRGKDQVIQALRGRTQQMAQEVEQLKTRLKELEAQRDAAPASEKSGFDAEIRKTMNLLDRAANIEMNPGDTEQQ